MPQPGKPAPRGEDWFVRELQNLRRELQELKAANPFGLTGIDPQDGGTEFDGYVNVNGPMSITGTLNLPAGIIGNDALTSPISPQTAHADVANFSLATGANVEKVRATVTVPDGYTRALVMASASLASKNTTTATDSMYVDCRVNGSVSGWSSQTSVSAGESGFVINVSTALLTGLGSSFYVAANASTGLAAWAASTTSAINVDAIVLFLR